MYGRVISKPLNKEELIEITFTIEDCEFMIDEFSGKTDGFYIDLIHVLNDQLKQAEKIENERHG